MKRHLPVLMLMLQTCAGLQAQTPVQEPAALTTTRTTFLRQVMSESQLITQQYERALAKVEADVAAAGDYEEARAIRMRREQLQALYAGTVSSLATSLPLTQARMMGSAQAAGETLSNWRSNGSGAEWANFRLMPGSYYLEFDANMSDAPVAGSIYASSKFQPQQTAHFEFDEVTLLGAAQENHRTFEITRSTDETTFTTVRVGPLTFTRNPVTLRFAATSGYPANIIRIRNLRLVPVTETATTNSTTAGSATSAPTNSTTAMQQASAALKEAIDAARKAAAEKYLDELKDLAVTKASLQKQVDAEIRRIERLGEQKTGPTGVRTITSTSDGFSGFEDISDARLAEEEPISGDRFNVVHDGRTMLVRLLWVDCAPLESDDPHVKKFARHFNIEDEDVLAVGRAAREFTASYLRDKPLRLLIRPDRDKDGTMAALLFVPNVGLYQNVLVNHGLAAVVPPARDKQHNAMERAFISILSALETTARNRRPAPGAWALSEGTNGGKQP
ncbi:thermonuclease family protein [Prosthecobacter sp.]|uniref:thermonuclease family protein n=1 Tax=Prosthecobacter sp. TaxID=1965333 RepID=UPI00378510C3